MCVCILWQESSVLYYSGSDFDPSHGCRVKFEMLQGVRGQLLLKKKKKKIIHGCLSLSIALSLSLFLSFSFFNRISI